MQKSATAVGRASQGRTLRITIKSFAKFASKNKAKSVPNAEMKSLEKLSKSPESLSIQNASPVSAARKTWSTFLSLRTTRSKSFAQIATTSKQKSHEDIRRIFGFNNFNFSKKAPRCSFCKKPIVPREGQKTAPRLRVMDRDFHPKCFQCEVTILKNLF